MKLILKPYRAAQWGAVQALRIAKLTNCCHRRLLAREDILYGLLAGDVLNLSAAEIICRGKRGSLLLAE